MGGCRKILSYPLRHLWEEKDKKQTIHFLHITEDLLLAKELMFDIVVVRRILGCHVLHFIQRDIQGMGGKVIKYLVFRTGNLFLF